MGLPRTSVFHDKVINALHGLNLKGNKGGVCAGIALLYVIYASQNKDEDYRRLMDRIASDDYLKKVIRLKEKIQNAANEIRSKKENIRQPVADTRQQIVTLTKSLTELKKPHIMHINTLSEELHNLNLKLLTQIRERKTHEYDLETKENYLTVEEREILDTFPFLEWIDITHQPQEYEPFAMELLRQTNIQELLDLLQSESPHKSEVVYTDSKIYDEIELKNYLNDLANTFQLLKEKHLPIIIDSRIHRVGLKYEAKKEVWRLEDPNFSREVKKEDIASELIKAVFDDKPNKLDKVYTVFNLYIISSSHSPSLQATKYALAIFKKNHKIASDMLERETASRMTLEDVVQRAGDVDAIKQIIEFKKDFYQSAKAQSFIYFAALRGYTQMFTWLKQNGVSLEQKDKNELNIFEMTATYGRISILKELKDDKFDINGIYGQDGARLTHIAASQGRDSFLRFIADSKPPADFKILDSKGRNPLFYAAYNGNLTTVHYLQEVHQLTFKKRDIKDVGFNAARNGDIDILKLLIKQGLDLNVKNYFSETLVHVAIRANQPEMVNYLIALNPSIIYQTTCSKDIPIFQAARLGHASIVQSLTQLRGYTLSKHPLTNDTLATFTVKQGFISVLKVLAEDKLLLSLENDHQMTPIQVATKQSNHNCSLIFMSYYYSVSQLEEKNVAYIITTSKFYYVNKIENKSISIPLLPETLKQLKKAFQAEKIELKENEKSRVLVSELESKELELITNISGHGFGSQMIKALESLLKQPEKDEKQIQLDLMSSANKGDQPSIKKLLEEFTPLELVFIAAASGHEAIIKILAEQQLIDVNDTRDDDISQNTLACIAADKGHASVIQTLKILGANLNKRRYDKKIH
jgi:ankyrin repeat protein